MCLICCFNILFDFYRETSADFYIDASKHFTIFCINFRQSVMWFASLFFLHGQKSKTNQHYKFITNISDTEIRYSLEPNKLEVCRMSIYFRIHLPVASDISANFFIYRNVRQTSVSDFRLCIFCVYILHLANALIVMILQMFSFLAKIWK